MSLVVERLGNGAALLLRDELAGVALLLGCGEARDSLGAGVAPDGGDGSARLAPVVEGGDGGAEGGEDAALAGLRSPFVRRYARELKDAATRGSGGLALAAVLIPDYRPQACGMLPFLTEWTAGSLPPVLMTHATRAIAPRVLSEYCGSTCDDKGAPFQARDIPAAFARARGVALRACVSVSESLKVTAYHAGHVAGGCAFLIEIGATSVLYAPDFNLTGGRVLLPAQIPRLQPTALFTRSSFAVSVSETASAMERELLRAVLECVSSNGKVVIPVHALGFFHDLAAILLPLWDRKSAATLHCPIYVSDAAMEFPTRFLPLIRRTCCESFDQTLRRRQQQSESGGGGGGTVTPLLPFDWSKLQQPGPFVLFTGPASIAQYDSHRAVKAVASDPRNLIVLSEGCTPGQLNYSLYADPERKEVNKRLGVSVACGVHYFPSGDETDAKSIVRLVSQVAPRQVLLDYSVAGDFAFLKTSIQNQLKTDPSVGSVVVKEIASTGDTAFENEHDIPLRIHKAMFNNPGNVQGVLIAEGKRKMMLVSNGNAARRLKKKKHSLNFTYSWKKEPGPSTRVKKKASRAPSSALSFLLSAAAESENEDEPEQQPQANVDDVLRSLQKSFEAWIIDVNVEKLDRWLKLRSVGISISEDWELNMEWNYEDEALAGRALGIAKQVVEEEYAKLWDE